MENLRLLTGGAFSLHYVPLLAASSLPKPLFDYFVRQLESFIFHYIFTKTPTKDLERNFSLWADELREIAAEADPKSQKDKLNQYISEHFEKGMQAKEAELHDALKRYSLFSMQKYRTRYFLAKLTQHVDLAYKGLKESGSLDEYIKLEIEHILPDNPKPELRADFEANNPQADYEDCKNRIGNLMDAQWARVEPLLPKNRPGARRVDDRRVISGIIHVLQSGCRWRDCTGQ